MGAGAQSIIEVVHDDYCMATWQRVFNDIWRVNTTVDGVRHLQSGFDALARETSGGLGLLTVVEAKAPLPPADARKALARFLSSASPRIKLSAVVFEGDGFRAAGVRGVVTGLTLMARPSYPHKIFSTVLGACQWFGKNFADHGKPVLDAVEMLAAIANLRHRIAVTDLSSDTRLVSAAASPSDASGQLREADVWPIRRAR
jgi:hypothetical protein